MFRPIIPRKEVFFDNFEVTISRFITMIYVFVVDKNARSKKVNQPMQSWQIRELHNA